MADLEELVRCLEQLKVQASAASKSVLVLAEARRQNGKPGGLNFHPEHGMLLLASDCVGNAHAAISRALEATRVAMLEGKS